MHSRLRPIARSWFSSWETTVEIAKQKLGPWGVWFCSSTWWFILLFVSMEMDSQRCLQIYWLFFLAFWFWVALLLFCERKVVCRFWGVVIKSVAYPIDPWDSNSFDSVMLCTALWTCRINLLCSFKRGLKSASRQLIRDSVFGLWLLVPDETPNLNPRVGPDRN